MNFFDKIIDETEEYLSTFEKRTYTADKQCGWSELEHSELIMLRDTAFELDGVGFNLVTSRNIGKDEIAVIGNELSQINSNTNFARLSLIQLDDVDDEQKAYNLIRKIEYAKYHFFPKGYMMRSTSRSHRESVRISASAIKEGLSFEKAGSLLIKKYKENPAVKAVKIIFITDKGADYKKLEALAKRNYEITETLNHIMNNINFDCDSCNLKPICDEVEGMKELHFKTAGRM